MGCGLGGKEESMCLQGFWPEQLQKIELLSTEVGELLREQPCKEEGRSVQFGVCYSDPQMGKSGGSWSLEFRRKVWAGDMIRESSVYIIYIIDDICLPISILLTCTFINTELYIYLVHILSTSIQ